MLFGPEPFGNELPSGLSLRVEDKAELLTADGRISECGMAMRDWEFGGRDDGLAGGKSTS
jgi:hypothetical protein